MKNSLLQNAGLMQARKHSAMLMRKRSNLLPIHRWTQMSTDEEICAHPCLAVDAFAFLLTPDS